MNIRRRLILLLLCLSLSPLRAGEVFVEAESFQSAGGWQVMTGPSARTASGLNVLSGNGGAKDGVATATVSIKDAGHYFIWVRYSSHPKWHGPFHVSALAGDRVLADSLFDMEFEGKSARDTQTWRSSKPICRRVR